MAKSEADRQTEIDEHSPSWVNRRLKDESTPPEGFDLDSYAITLPFKEPKWTGSNGWKKWHAGRDCGHQTVYLIEDSLADTTTPDSMAWKLYCARCGALNWQEVLFIHESWYYELPDRSDRVSWEHLGMFRNLWFPPEEVCKIGGVPSSSEVEELIRRSYYEEEAENRMTPLEPWEKSNE